MSFFQSLKSQNWLLNGAIVLLSTMSLITLSSLDMSLFWRQVLYFFFGFCLIIFLPRFNIRPLLHSSFFIYGLYGLIIILLVVTLFVAPTIRNTRSWIAAGPFKIQISEFAKIGLILLLAHFWSTAHVRIYKATTILKSLILFLIPAVLILKQPDLGTVLILFGIWAMFILVSGPKPSHIIAGFLLLVIVGGIGGAYFLKDYQKARIFSFFRPSYDTLGVNYNMQQAKIAIGSGGIWGKGYREGTQSHLGYLPEASTDFIFAAFIEEWGFFGFLIWSLCWVLLFYALFKITTVLERNTLVFCVFATGALFFIQSFINIGSNLGFFPVVGVSLPFFSYGGSNLLTSFILVAIIQSIFAQQTIFKKGVGVETIGG